MKIKTKITVELSVKDLMKALETGAFTGRKIRSIEWVYKSVVDDPGRGNATYKDVVSGVVLELDK